MTWWMARDANAASSPADPCLADQWTHPEAPGSSNRRCMAMLHQSYSKLKSFKSKGLVSMALPSYPIVQSGTDSVLSVTYRYLISTPRCKYRSFCSEASSGGTATTRWGCQALSKAQSETLHIVTVSHLIFLEGPIITALEMLNCCESRCFIQWIQEDGMALPRMPLIQNTLGIQL